MTKTLDLEYSRKKSQESQSQILISKYEKTNYQMLERYKKPDIDFEIEIKELKNLIV